MLIRLTGYVAAALFAFGIFVVLSLGKNPGPRLKMPMLTMEFLDSEAALHGVIGTPGDQRPDVLALREWLKANIRFDYGFIVLYWLLFVLIAWVLARRGGGGMWLGAAAALAITGAAIFDVMENVRMTRVIDTVQLAGNDVASAGYLKWLLSFVAIGLLSFTFFGRGGLVPVIGVVCVAIAVVGVAGLVAVRTGRSGVPIINLAFFMMMLGLLPMVLVAFNFFRGRFTG